MDMPRGFRSKMDAYFDCNSEITVSIAVNGSSIYDSCCFGLDVSDKIKDDRYTVFYNQASSPNGEITLKGSGSQSFYTVTLSRLPSHVSKLAFTLSIDGNGFMGSISSLNVTVSQGVNMLRLSMVGSDFRSEKAVIAIELYRKDGWRISAVASGFNGGLPALLKHYGGEEKTEPKIPPLNTPQPVSPPIRSNPVPPPVPQTRPNTAVRNNGYIPPQPTAPILNMTPPGIQRNTGQPRPLFTQTPAAVPQQTNIPTLFSQPNVSNNRCGSLNPNPQPNMSPPPTVQSSSCSLQRGQKISLERNGGSIIVENGWTAPNKDYDLKALVRYRDGRQVYIGAANTDEFMQTPEGAVRHGGDVKQSGQHETLYITWHKDIASVALSSYSAMENGAGSFNRYGVYVKIINGSQTVEIPATNVNADDNSYTLCFGEIIFGTSHGKLEVIDHEMYSRPQSENRIGYQGDRVVMDIGPIGQVK